MFRLVLIYLFLFIIGIILGSSLKCLALNLVALGIIPSIINSPLVLDSILANNATAIFTGFWGGLFAGIWGYHYQSKGRKEEKRADKYFEHRNAIVQIEHELSPVRLNLSRNINSLEGALQNTSENNIRLLLRFFKLELSSGLNLKLVNLDMINQYVELYSLLTIINSDFEYTSGIINRIRNRREIDASEFESSLETYKTMIPYLKNECELADKKSLELLAFCKLTLTVDTDKQKTEYIRTGGLVQYSFTEDVLKKRSEEIITEETLPYKAGKSRPKFVALYLDLKRQTT